MQLFLNAIDSALGMLRVGLLGVAAVLAAVCGVDWMVRTRKLSPFGPIARFMRSTVDPLLKPVERRVVRSGGLPSSAPWWALGAVVLAGIMLLWVLEFVRSQIAFLYYSLTGGPAALGGLVVTIAFTVVRVALLVRVLLTWFPMRPGAWYWRWSYAITEPILKPVRKIIPPIGMMDITPIVVWFLLGLLEGVVIRAL
jgi:YggT family protein